MEFWHLPFDAQISNSFKRIAKQTKMGKDYHVYLNSFLFQWYYSFQEKYRISNKRFFFEIEEAV